MSRPIGKPTICLGENKDADQLRSNCEADERLCFRYMDNTIYLLSKSKISSLQPSSVLVHSSVCVRRFGTARFVSDLVGNLIVGFPTRRLKCSIASTKHLSSDFRGNTRHRIVP